MNTQALWFSDDGSECPYTGPSFFGSDEFPQVKELEENWQIIRDEVLELLRSIEVKAYLDKSLVKGKNAWKTQSIVFWDFIDKSTCKKCPKTWSLLRKIDGLSTASINILEANTEIKPHVGDTNAVIRAHLPLIVPSSDPSLCGFRVLSETQPWKEGKVLLFPDSQRHTAWNRTQHPRLVLLFDILKPEYRKSKRAYICCRVLGKIYADAHRGKRKLWDKTLGPGKSRQVLRTAYRWMFTLAYRCRSFTRLSMAG